MSDQLGKFTIKIKVLESNLEGDRYELSVKMHDKYLVERITMPKTEEPSDTHNPPSAQ
jgi:hypothetical protein